MINKIKEFLSFLFGYKTEDAPNLLLADGKPEDRHEDPKEEYVDTQESPYNFCVDENRYPIQTLPSSPQMLWKSIPTDEKENTKEGAIEPRISLNTLKSMADLHKDKSRKKTKKQTAASNASWMMEVLKWTDSLTATQLQKVSKVRRDRFLPLLKKLVKQGKIARTGSGKRGNPYRYSGVKT